MFGRTVSQVRNAALAALRLLPCATLHSGSESIGTTSANFLKILPPARAAGMGEAYSALSDDEGGFSYNPAGMANSLQDEVSATHMEWFQGVRLEHIGGLFTWGPFGKVGLHMTTLTSGPQFRTERTGLSSSDASLNFRTTGTFTPYDNLYGLVLAQNFGRHLSLGTNLKVVQQSIDLAHGYGFDFDFGAHYDRLFENLDLGLVAHNLGTQIAVGSQPSAEPFTLATGLNFWVRDGFSLAAEAVLPLDNALEVSGGA